jgi:hypothetical protein
VRIPLRNEGEKEFRILQLLNVTPVSTFGFVIKNIENFVFEKIMQ